MEDQQIFFFYYTASHIFGPTKVSYTDMTCRQIEIQTGRLIKF
jgi:hypothetical protein